MKKVVKWVWRILEVLIIVYAVSITSLILFRNRFGYTQVDQTTLVTVTEDNKETLGNVKEKDLLLIENPGSKGIKEGDEIYYYATINNEYVIQTGTVASITADDTNAVYVLNDKDKTSISSTRVMGKYKTSYSDVGGILEFLQGRIGFLIFVLLPILLIFIYQIYDLVISFKYAPSNEDDDDEEKEDKKEVKEEKPVAKEVPKEEIKEEIPKEEDKEEEVKPQEEIKEVEEPTPVPEINSKETKPQEEKEEVKPQEESSSEKIDDVVNSEDSKDKSSNEDEIEFL